MSSITDTDLHDLYLHCHQISKRISLPDVMKITMMVIELIGERMNSHRVSLQDYLCKFKPILKIHLLAKSLVKIHPETIPSKISIFYNALIFKIRS